MQTDLGGDWTHQCVVGEVKVDLLEVLGIRPDAPLPYWGWGSIPDQYGRRWATDDGEPGARETGPAAPDAAARVARTGAGAGARLVRAA